MKRMTMLAAALALLAWTEGHARAQIPREGPFKVHCSDALVQSLGLSDGQTGALAVLRAQTESAVSTIRAQEKTLHESIHTAVSSASPDQCAIGGLMIQGSALHQQIETMLANAESTFVASLTSDQKAKYDAFLSAHPECKVFGLPMHPPGF